MVLVIVLVLIMLRRDEALDRVVLRPFKNFVGGAGRTAGRPALPSRTDIVRPAGQV